MYYFSNSQISTATKADLPVIEKLLNSAYRGGASQKGWTTEAHLIDGETRTTQNDLQQVIQQPGSVFLKYLSPSGEITGCVNLQKHDNKIYLGMFAVSPLQQGSGTGKQLLAAAEEYAKHVNCTAIYMSVISLRHELIGWYMRHGYADTGERKPFYEDGITGRHLQALEFMILEKKV
jgi:ribosomal protein S18 acetylase RimI-like enzyme